MKRYLFVGASSSIAIETANILRENEVEIVGISRQENPYVNQGHVVVDYTSTLPVIEGEFDGLVYFPGSIILKPFRSLKLEDFQGDLNINFLGAVNALRQYHSQLKTGSSVVLISTVAAKVGMPFHASIASSKSAIEGLAKSLAAEWAPKIRVNVVAPSLTETPLADRLTNTPEKAEGIAARHPMKRMGQASDQAKAIKYLLTDDSTWVTGQIMAVDGGMGSLKA